MAAIVIRRMWLITALAMASTTAGCDGADRAVTGPPVSTAAAGIFFRDVAAEAGLDFRWGHDGKSPLTILESLGHGCAFLDYDQDGFQDIFLVSDRTSRLYRNDGTGKFEDVTKTTLASVPGYWHGVGVGDFDNDGDTDLCVAGYRCIALLKNEGRRFRNVTQESGLQVPEWGTSCAFVDLDEDGHLDLVVGEYLEFGKQSVQYCTIGDVKTACGPKIYEPRFPSVYRNTGGTFRDVTREWGFGTASGKCLGMAFGDFDGDGRLDVAFANDEMPGNLFVREPGGKVHFRDVGADKGFAFLANGKVQSGMGIDAADYDGDGLEDLIVTNFQNEQDGLYRNENGVFTEVSAASGLSEPTFPTVGWGVRFLDADNDGNQDLLVANGHIQDNVHLTGAQSSYAQPLLMLAGQGLGQFIGIGHAAGSAFATPIVGRGLAVGDYDNDGRTDALVVNLEGRPLLLHNESRSGLRWAGFDVLSGTPPRPALGARVIVEGEGFRILRRVSASGSIFAGHDSRVLVGLGKHSRIERVVVRWPNGTEESFAEPPCDRYTRIVAGNGEAFPAHSGR